MYLRLSAVLHVADQSCTCEWLLTTERLLVEQSRANFRDEEGNEVQSPGSSTLVHEKRSKRDIPYRVPVARMVRSSFFTSEVWRQYGDSTEKQRGQHIRDP